jgi:hypothetical protein
MIEEVTSPHPTVAEAVAEIQELGVWLIESNPAVALAWESLLAAAARTGTRPLILRGRLAPDAAALSALRRGPGEVLLVSGPPPEGDDWRMAVLASGKGVVVAAAFADAVRADNVPSALVPPSPPADVLAFALHSADAAARRETWVRDECAQLQQRLHDRILLERAKGVIQRRLNVSEEEAYRRLRATARRQRRALREVARSVLDTEGLLDGPAPPTPSAAEEAKR